ncbi:MAG: oligosaccharide flippase family protein [Patescibacteria group bacterium]|jgi:PST family polysaccharide transporter
MPDKYIRKAIKSVRWSFLGELANRLISPFITLILVRILSPDIFGIFGAVMAIFLLLETFADLGITKALIRMDKKKFLKSADTAFWALISFSVFLYLIIFILSPLVANFYHTPIVKTLMRILALDSFLPGAVFSANLQRNFKFNKIFISGGLSLIIPGLVTIPLALLGYGIWSFVIGNLVSSLINFLYIFYVSGWRPKLNFKFNIAKSLIRSNFWIISENILLWFFPYGEFVIVGHYLGTQTLGLYQTAFSVLNLFFGIAIGHSIPVSYALFSKVRSDQPKLRNLIMKITQLIGTISFPLGIAISLLAQPLSTYFFGQRWLGIETIIAILGIRAAFGFLLVAMPEALRAMGRADINVKLGIIGMFYFVPFYLITIRYGIRIFALSTILIMLIDMLIFMIVINKVLKIKITFYINALKYPILGTAVMSAVLLIIKHFLIYNNFAGFLNLILTIILAVFTYTIILYIFQKKLLQSMLSIIKQALT